MSAAAIKAGKSWVELALKDKTDAGLDNARRKFLRWGVGLAKVGSVITAAAGGILGSLTAAAKAFADTGSEIFDLSRTTGVGAAELSALGYAAEQSGASLADVGSAFKGLSKFTGQLAVGSSAAQQALSQLGISSAEFLRATPYEKFLLVAEALQGISDPSLRAALGMQLLGRGAQALGSLLAEGASGVAELVAEAQRLGLVVTQAEAAKADALGDAWDAVGKQFKQIAFVVGSQVAEILTTILKSVQPLLAGTIAFIRQNQILITGLATAAAIAGAVGVAFLGAAVAAFAVAAAIQVVNVAMAAYTAITAAAAVVTAALITPWGLVIASLGLLGATLIAAGAYWLYFNETARAAIQGVYDALVSGQWALAGQIMGATLNLAWQGAISDLKLMWVEFKAWLLQLFASLADELQNIPGLGKLLDLQGAAGLARTASSAGVASAQSAEVAAIAKATSDLAALIDQAAKAREEAFRVKLPPTPSFGGGQGAAATPLDPAFATGTFNAAASQLLGQAGESTAERTARAAEATVEKLDEVKAAVEDIDLSDAE